MTAGPTIRSETANNGDDAPADGIEGDDADQQEGQDHQRCTALPVALNPCDHDSGAADQQRTGEKHSTGPGKPKPVTKPSPIAPESGHA